jgi:hypothetical protein
LQHEINNLSGLQFFHAEFFVRETMGQKTMYHLQILADVGRQQAAFILQVGLLALIWPLRVRRFGKREKSLKQFDKIALGGICAF